MIKQIEQDILKSECNIIVHQVNTIGVMGAGLALQIRRKYEACHKAYINLCQIAMKKGKSHKLMGKVLFVNVGEDKIIANIFAQSDIGTYKVQTDYEALKSGLEKVRERALEEGYSVAIPVGIGCGLAGGDWITVMGIIKEIFEESSVDVTLCKWG